MLLEDDFPLCDNEWSTIQGIMAQAYALGLRPCGFFFGTGGRFVPWLYCISYFSGLVIRNDLVDIIAEQLVRSIINLLSLTCSVSSDCNLKKNTLRLIWLYNNVLSALYRHVLFAERLAAW
jgi:hypothetical protein